MNARLPWPFTSLLRETNDMQRTLLYERRLPPPKDMGPRLPRLYNCWICNLSTISQETLGCHQIEKWRKGRRVTTSPPSTQPRAPSDAANATNGCTAIGAGGRRDGTGMYVRTVGEPKKKLCFCFWGQRLLGVFFGRGWTTTSAGFRGIFSDAKIVTLKKWSDSLELGQ
jgi:hypothetical protein